MGLDIYAMPLSRFWSGCWESVQTQFGRQLGVPGWTIRPFSEPEKHPDEAPVFPARYSEWIRSHPEVLGPKWQATGPDANGVPPPQSTFPPFGALLDQLDLESIPWDEEDWGRCVQEQLGWDSLTALLNYSQAPGAGRGAPVPAQAVRDWSCPPVDEGTVGRLPYPHLAITSAHLGQWLPGEIEDMVCVEMASTDTGKQELVVFGSLLCLLRELDDINRDWGLERDWGELRKGEGVAAEDDPHARAKTGWALIRSMCRKALDLDLPLVLSG